MAIARVSTTSGDTSFANFRNLLLGSNSDPGRVILGQFDNDSTTEHLTSAVDPNPCTLGTEELYAGVTNANAAYLIGDSVINTTAVSFKGNYTDGNHKPGGVGALYTGVGAISIVAQGHGDTGGIPNVPISLSASGLNSGDVLVAFFAFFGGASVSFTPSHGTEIIDAGGVSFRYVMVELTASGSSATIDGTPSSRASWIGYMFRLEPVAAGGSTTVNRRTLGQRVGSRQGGFIRLGSGLMAPRRFASNRTTYLEAA